MRMATHNAYEIGWHHTSLSAAVSILSNDYVYASWATTLNDSKEVLHGAGALRDAAKVAGLQKWPHELVELVTDVDALKALVQEEAFVFSVSAHENALNNWALYGPVALGFAISNQHTSTSAPLMAVINERWKSQEKSGDLARPNGMSAWHGVLYDPALQRSEAEGTLTKIAQLVGNSAIGHEALLLQARGDMIRYVLTMKHPDFAPEGETRFIAYRPDDIGSVHYRESDGNVIPYVKVTANHRTGQQYASGTTDEVGAAQTLPIYVIKLDASVSAEAEVGLNDLYRRRGHGEAEDIERSDTPYRRSG